MVWFCGKLLSSCSVALGFMEYLSGNHFVFLACYFF